MDKKIETVGSPIKKTKRGSIVTGVDGNKYAVDQHGSVSKMSSGKLATYNEWLANLTVNSKSMAVSFLVLVVTILSAILCFVNVYYGAVGDAMMSAGSFFAILGGAATVGFLGISPYLFSPKVDKDSLPRHMWKKLLENPVIAPVMVVEMSDPEKWKHLREFDIWAAKVVEVAEKVGGETGDQAISAVRAIIRDVPKTEKSLEKVQKSLWDLEASLNLTLDKRKKREAILEASAKLLENEVIEIESDFANEQLLAAIEASEIENETEDFIYGELDAEIKKREAQNLQLAEISRTKEKLLNLERAKRSNEKKSLIIEKATK